MTDATSTQAQVTEDTPWSVEIDAGVEQINDAHGNWVAETARGKAQRIVDAVNALSAPPARQAEKTKNAR